MTAEDTHQTKPGPGSAPLPKGTAPVAELIGFDVEEIGAGRSVVLFPAGARHHNPFGPLHGGILCDVADAAMGMATYSTLAEGESFTTLELKINFLRTVRQEKLRAVGEVVHRGRTTVLAQCDVTDERERLVARVSSTCLVLQGDAAKGR